VSALAPAHRSERRRATDSRRFNPLAFVIASFAAAAILVPIVLVPQHLSKQARWEVLRSHVGEMGRAAASVVDGDLHRQLLDRANYSDELYVRALAPLVRFHSANPDIFYVYTMVDRGGTAYFVLDTAASPDLHVNHHLRASGYMERFDLGKEYEDDWLEQIAAGKTYVTPTFEQDDYGDFLTAHAPIYDSKGRYSGFVGVDFDVKYYLAEEKRFRAIALGTLAAALLMALVIGYLVAQQYSSMQHRVRGLYDSSIRDALTGLLNRRGMMDAVERSLARQATSYAMLLVDIDNLKIVNDVHGLMTGDAVIVRTAEAIRESVREGDECARLGGDEFMVFAADCDADQATEIAKSILAKVSKPDVPLVARFSLSIGIAVHDKASADFDQMYREAGVALNRIRTEGKSHIAVFVPSKTDALDTSAALTLVHK
jgi:diguanylate cyclase (GGDEF)-like protein